MGLHKGLFSKFFVSNNKKIFGELKNESNEVHEKSNNLFMSIVFYPEDDFYKLKNICFSDFQNDLPLELKAFSKSYDINLLSIYNEQCESAILKLALNVAANKRLRNLFADKENNSFNDLDEQIFLHLTCDKMFAWIMFFPPIGNGKSLTASQINEYLSKQKVVYGIDDELINSLPVMEDKYFNLFLAAVGTKPINGNDGYIVEHFPRNSKNNEVEVLEDMEYMASKLSQTISEGDIICDIIPPDDGVAGINVNGIYVNAKKGKDVNIPMGRNTALSNDGKYLIAISDGYLEFSSNEFHIKPILDLKDDVKETKDAINFLGDIHIHGDVYDGVTIRATGNVRIDGVVHACTIEAGENIFVLSGIQGQDCAIIRAHKNIYSKYLEHCTVFSRGNIYAECIIECNVYCNGNIKAITGRGAINGGSIRCAKTISANIVGSKAEKITEIILGGVPYDDFERIKIIEEIKVINNEIQKLELQPDTPKNKSEISKLRLNTYVARMKLDIFDKELNTILASQAINDNRFLICEAVYPGTTVYIDYKDFHIVDLQNNCTIGLSNGYVCRIK